jgi:hypothetical protein
VAGRRGAPRQVDEVVDDLRVDGVGGEGSDHPPVADGVAQVQG